MLLDTRTIVVSTAVTEIVCLLVIVALWRQNRGRRAGIGHWVLAHVAQMLALFLIVLRGRIPDWASMVLSNTLIVGGALLSYLGLERFLGRRSSQVHNYVLLPVFAAVHGYFALVRPDLALRTLILSVALVIVCLQCLWLLLHRAPPGLRRLTSAVSMVFAGYTAVSVARIVEFFVASHTATDFFQTGAFDRLVLISYQMLFILLTHGLVLMVNQRLLMEVGNQEEKFSKAFHSAPYAITLTRLASGQIVEVNEGFSSMTGYQREEVVAKTTIALHLWDAEEDRAAVVEALSSSGKVRAREARFRKKSGALIEGLFSAEIIPVNGEELVLSSIADLTELREARRERESLEVTLAQSDRLASMGLLAAGVAHEINNPLAYVIQSLESLEEDLPGFANERLREALGGARRIAQITRSLSTFSRVERTELAPVDVEDSIEHALTLASNEIRHRARVVREYSPIPAVLASDGKLAQVFLNLIINAVQAIAEGQVEKNELRVRTWGEGEEVFVEVSDTGKGIAPEHLGKVFDPFFTTKGVGVGSGLGLSICKSIVTSLGGEIGFTSELGQGTRFQVRLPCLRGGRAVSAGLCPVQPRASAGIRGRILVVDDELGIRRAIVRLLGRDHEVITAESGEDGRELLEKDRGFDLIVCDLMMPNISGMELHAWLSTQDPELAERVVFVTGGAFTPGAAEYLARVGNQRLEKPFDSGRFRKLVEERVLAARRGQATCERAS